MKWRPHNGQQSRIAVCYGVSVLSGNIQKQPSGFQKVRFPLSSITVAAHAKINLTLYVGNKRSDGYHDIDSIMHQIVLSDEITVSADDSLRLHVAEGNAPAGEDNLMWTAARRFLDAGASHVIVTSYVFKDGKIHFDRLKDLAELIGNEHLVLDLSCRKKDNDYYIVTDRWQKFTSVKMNLETMEMLSPYCDEFLIHAVDVEGKASGIEKPLAELLGSFTVRPVTYAGGVGSFEDLRILKELGQNHINVTIGSALDLFGGPIPYETVKYLGTENEVTL